MNKKLKYFLIFIAQFVVVSFLINRYKSDIYEFIQTFAIKIRSIKGGVLILISLTALFSVPPLIGFDLTLTIIGFTYGFPRGCLPALIGSLLGAMITFSLVRYFRFSRFIKLSESNKEKFNAMQLAIKQEGAKMVILIRLCPLPWQLTNLFLSLCDTIDTKLYFLTSIPGALRFNLDVWFGSQLATLTDPNLPAEAHKASFVMLIIGVCLLLSSGIWLYRVTNEKIKEIQLSVEQEEQRERNSLINNQDSYRDYSSISTV